MRLILTLVVLAFCGTPADAGPVRRWVAEHRPGIIVPKRTQHAAAQPRCTSCAPSCACPARACPSRCPVAGQPQPTAGLTVDWRTGLPCPNGRCPKR